MTIKERAEISQLALNWYQQLVNDCSQLISEAKEQIVFKHWQMGKRILEDELKFEKPEYGSHFIENLAKDLGIGQTTIKYELQFARQYPEFANALTDFSWRYVIGLLGKGNKAHVAQATGESEWYTPSEYIEAARQVMGSIDVDPASTNKANEIVKAATYFTEEIDGRCQNWTGKVWLNPPYSQPLVSDFCGLLVTKFEKGEILEACVLVNNATETQFYQDMLRVCSAVCFIKGRVKFISNNGNQGAPLQGQTVLYFGAGRDKFRKHFDKFGVILYAK